MQSNHQEPRGVPERALRDAYAQAEADERSHWQAVKGKPPGQPGYDGPAWDEWLSSVKQLQRAATQLQEALQRTKR